MKEYNEYNITKSEDKNFPGRCVLSIGHLVYSVKEVEKNNDLYKRIICKRSDDFVTEVSKNKEYSNDALMPRINPDKQR